MRKSPYRHHVRAHRRKGKPVNSYERGKGKAPVQTANPTVHNKPQSSGMYICTIKYAGLASETVNVTAPDYPTAIENSMITRRNVAEPLEVEATRT